jgi:hypothetical protein
MQPADEQLKPSPSRKRLITAALVAGALVGSAGVAAAATSSTTTTQAPAAADGTAKVGSNEDPTHEASETPEQEAAEDAGLGHRGHGRGNNEDPAHEATESPEREAAEHAQGGSAPTAPSAPSSPAS